MTDAAIPAATLVTWRDPPAGTAGEPLILVVRERQRGDRRERRIRDEGSEYRASEGDEFGGRRLSDGGARRIGARGNVAHGNVRRARRRRVVAVGR